MAESVAYHFEQINLWTVPATLLLIPAAFMSLAAALGKLLLTLLCPWLAHGWAIGAGVPASALRHEVAWLAGLPACDIPLRSPPLWLICLYYGLLLLSLLPWRKLWVRRSLRCARPAR